MSRTCKEIRREFIEFFEQRGHTFVPSSPLLPAEDPTLLFTNAGMNQFKDIFLGREKRDYVRATNTQKCIRAGGKHNDLEDVGHDTYHHTFFEMLGNWSFGDYFKREAISWAWELLTGVWGLPKDRLYVTVFEGDAADGLEADDDARRLWREVTDIDPSHIHNGGKKDNFWEMGATGPCGPCSEIHIDLTEDGSGAKLVNAGDPRVIELWNLVFMQYSRDEKGALSPLPATHVDTGLGLERVGMVLQGKRSNYATDLFTPIIEKIETLTEHRYGLRSRKRKDGDRFDTADMTNMGDVACRVIADHARTLTFAIADGVVPSNEGRGYVLRRILRRAARYGRQYLDIDGPFLAGLVPTVVELMGETFGEIVERQKYVVETIRGEEESFGRTLDNGIKTWWSFAGAALRERFRKENYDSSKPDSKRLWIHMSEQIASESLEFYEETHLPVLRPETNVQVTRGLGIDRQTGKKVPYQILHQFKLGDLTPKLTKKLCRKPPKISGEDAFKLYATYGFPFDLTSLMAKERGLDVDLAGFDEEMARHRDMSSTAGGAFQSANVPDLPETDDSAKYAPDPVEAKVLGWVINGKYVSDGALLVGDEAAVVLEQTNFYAEQGGQVGDAGHLRWEGGPSTGSLRSAFGSEAQARREHSGSKTGQGKFAVRDTQPAGGGILHVGVVEAGELRPDQTVSCEVDPSRRDTMRNHSATHLLNWALREVLGDHVGQAGSVVAPDRLRFDFTHNQAVTAEQLAEAERLVNKRVLADDPVTATIKPLAEAKKIPGVRAVFGEKYPDPVRVVAMGVEDPLATPERDCNIEFCGGTHLERTSQVGLFKILSEESVAKGIRRITAITGFAAVEYVQRMDGVLRSAAAALKVAPEQIAERISAMQKEIKDLRKKPGAKAGAEDVEAEVVAETPHGQVLVARVDTADASAMRSILDRQRQKGAAAMLIGGADGGKVTLVAMVSDELVKAGAIKAGDWVKAVAPVVSGGGGGKATMAQAGGKQPDKLPEALQAAAEWVREKL